MRTQVYARSIAVQYDTHARPTEHLPPMLRGIVVVHIRVNRGRQELRRSYRGSFRAGYRGGTLFPRRKFNFSPLKHLAYGN